MIAKKLNIRRFTANHRVAPTNRLCMSVERFEVSRVTGAPVSDSELIADLRRVAESAGTAKVTQRLYADIGRYDVRNLSRRFGTWNKALEAADLDLSNQVDLPDDKLFENILVLWQHYGRQPRRAGCHSLHLLFLKALIVGGFEHGSMLLKASFLGPMQAKLLPRNLVLSLRTKHNPEPAEIHRYGYDSRYSKAIGSAAAIAGPVQPRSPVSSYILTTKSLGAKVEKRFLKISKPFARHAISANPMTTPSNPVDGTHRSVAGLQRHT